MSIVSSNDQSKPKSSDAQYVDDRKTQKDESSGNFVSYLSVESATGGMLNYDGSMVVFAYNGPGLYQVYCCDVKEGITCWPKRLSSCSTDRCTNPVFLDDGSIIYVSDAGCNEKFQIHMIDYNKTNKSRKITTDNNAKHVLSKITKNYLYFVANIKNKSYFDVYRCPIPIVSGSNQNEEKQMEFERIYENSQYGIVTVDCIDENDSLFIINKAMIYRRYNELVLCSADGKINKVLTKKYNDPKKDPSLESGIYVWKGIKFLNENYVLLNSSYKSDFTRPIIFDLNKNEIIFLNEIEENKSLNCVDFEHFGYFENSIYAVTNTDGYSRLYRMRFTDHDQETVNNKAPFSVDIREIILPSKGVIVAGYQGSSQYCINVSKKDGKILTISFENSTGPCNVWAMNTDMIDKDDMNKGESNKSYFWQLTDVSTPNLHKDIDFVSESLCKFETFDGLTVPYFEYIPSGLDNGGDDGDDGGSKHPIMFCIHGGPESQYRPYFVAHVQFFVNLGFIVIAPNVRGSSGYGTKYMNLDNKGKRLDAVKDVKALVSHIKEKYKDNKYIDVDNCIVFGGSYGGFMVLSSMCEYPSLFKAGIDIVGVTNFITFLKNTADWRRKLREHEYGSLSKDYEILRNVSPFYKIDKIEAPLFIIQGDNDERVPVSESLQVYEKLKEKCGKSKYGDDFVRLLRLPDEGHGISKRKNKILAYSQLATWLKDIGFCK